MNALRGMLRKLARDLLLNRLGASVLLNSPLRVALLRRLGMAVDPSAFLQSGLWFSGRDVSVGAGTRISPQCYFDETAPITIGANVNFGPQVMVHTSDHRIGSAARRCGTQIAAPVSIGDGTWLGMRASVLPGVSIGAGCVIAAGAMVVSDCEPNGFYAGVPARRRRELVAPDGDQLGRGTFVPRLSASAPASAANASARRSPPERRSVPA